MEEYFIFLFGLSRNQIKNVITAKSLVRLGLLFFLVDYTLLSNNRSWFWLFICFELPSMTYILLESIQNTCDAINIVLLETLSILVKTNVHIFFLLDKYIFMTIFRVIGKWNSWTCTTWKYFDVFVTTYTMAVVLSK